MMSRDRGALSECPDSYPKGSLLSVFTAVYLALRNQSALRQVERETQGWCTWDDPEGWDGKGVGRGFRMENMYTKG